MLFCIRRRTLVASCMIIFFGLASTLVAQTDRGTITGTVTDPTGAVIVGAKVTATNTATRISTETAASSTGKYTIPLLLPGTYEVSGRTKQASRNTFRQALYVEVAQTVRGDVAMQLGESSQSVEVTADLVQVQKRYNRSGNCRLTGQRSPSTCRSLREGDSAIRQPLSRSRPA